LSATGVYAAMKLPMRLFVFVVALVIAFLSGMAAQGQVLRLPAGFQRMNFTVDGVAREALVYVPATAKTTNMPVVFVFHGHGGTARSAVRSFALNQHWPAAISVYMQGLNTPGRLTDPEGKLPGWQSALGAQDDRDLKFFDAVLARLKQNYSVDAKRIYATGHSNGGGFTYLLWLARGEIFAAVAPSAAVASYVSQLKPKPAMHLAGEQDPLVKFAWQKATMDAVRRLNGCDAEGTAWDKQCTLYPSKTGTPLVTFIHAGGHEFDPNAPRLIVKFFQEHPAPAK
jgi:polyhydroxybutyrate depolymerase